MTEPFGGYGGGGEYGLSSTPNIPSHVRYTFTGQFGPVGGAAEVWSFRLNGVPVQFADQAARQSVANSLAAAWNLQLGPILRSDCLLTRVRVSQHATGGKTTKTPEGQYEQADWEGTEAGDALATPRMPLQAAVVVSLQTNRAGPSGKGRVFLPMPQMAIGADYLLALADATNIANRFAAFVRDINAAAGPTSTAGDVAVASVKGHLSRVTSVRVGRVVDTQRSRRNALPESYVTTAL